ncbi:MAG: Helicase associated domain protein [Lachnospiraceae bacterium]|nr:Helicase associated domain protein [Lachnospiraceae bacterium]
MDLKLFEHNQKAYESAIFLMEETGKAAIIHPTGTGKSLIAFQLAADNVTKQIVWLAPSEYIFRTQLENVIKILRGQNICHFYQHTESLEFFLFQQNEESVVETDSQHLQQKLTKTNLESLQNKNEKQIDLFLLESIFSNIHFLTYAKLMHHEDWIEVLKPDYIVLDEFHRCGAAEWGKSVSKLLEYYPNAKLLGLSATNIRYLDNQRDMAQEIFEGNIASEMSLGEAIARHILPTPKYVLSMYAYEEELKYWKKRVSSIKSDVRKKENEKILEQLRRALEQSEGIEHIFARHMRKKDGKYLVFCADKAHMEEMLSVSKEWFFLVDKQPHIYIVTYDNPMTSQEFTSFKKDTSNHLKLLFCIDMLNEGVHVDGVDGVILLRPTVSPILYFQQIGRTLSTKVVNRVSNFLGKDEIIKQDYLELEEPEAPVIFDIVNNFEALYSIDSLQSEIKETFTFQHYGEQEKRKFQNSFRIYDEIRECRELFTQLKRNLSATWEQYYLLAKQYYEQHKNLSIPKSYVTETGLTLGTWLMTQRRIRVGKVVGHLSKEQILRLDEIGMEWENGQTRSWNRGYTALKQYVETYGNADVKADYVTEEGYALGKWISNLRSKWNRGEVEKFKYNQDSMEEIKVLQEESIKKEENTKKKNPKKVVSEISYTLPKNCITYEQVQMLNELGMIWDKNAYQWNRNFYEAKKYFENNGNLNVPHDFITTDGIRLGTWINNQKNIYAGKKRGAAPLTQTQVECLESIGIVWRKTYQNLYENIQEENKKR